MFFIIKEGQAAPKGAQMPTCFGPYTSAEEAVDELRKFTVAGTYQVVGPAEATGDVATIEPVKVTVGKASK